MDVHRKGFFVVYLTTVEVAIESQYAWRTLLATKLASGSTSNCSHSSWILARTHHSFLYEIMAVATGPVGPVSTGPLFVWNHLIAGFARTQSICYLVVADTCWSSLWWQRRSLYRRSPKSPIIARQGLHFPNDRSWNQNECCALRRVIGSIAGRFCTMTKFKMLCFATRIFSVSCFVSGASPQTWSYRILVISAVLLRVTVRHYT